MAVAACAGAGVELVIAGVAAGALGGGDTREAMLMLCNVCICVQFGHIGLYDGWVGAAVFTEGIAVRQQIENLDTGRFGIDVAVFAVCEFGVARINNDNRIVYHRTVAPNIQCACALGAAQRELGIAIVVEQPERTGHDQLAQHLDVDQRSAVIVAAGQGQRTVHLDGAVNPVSVQIERQGFAVIDADNIGIVPRTVCILQQSDGIAVLGGIIGSIEATIIVGAVHDGGSVLLGRAALGEGRRGQQRHAQDQRQKYAENSFFHVLPPSYSVRLVSGTVRGRAFRSNFGCGSSAACRCRPPCLSEL